MGLMNKFNESRPFSDVDTTGLNYMNLGDLFEQFGEDHVYHLKGLFINPKGKFGSEPVAILENCLVNLPRHIVEAVQEMLDDDEVIKAIRADKVGFKIYSYTNKYSKGKGKFCGVEWLDL